jgi:hypothetical protein
LVGVRGRRLAGFPQIDVDSIGSRKLGALEISLAFSINRGWIRRKTRRVLKAGAVWSAIMFATLNGGKREVLRRATLRAKKYPARAEENLKLD